MSLATIRLVAEKPADGQPKQTTRTGVEIPVPKREDFLRDLKKAAPPAKPKDDAPNKP
jgi:hypothetical protein